MAKKRKTPQTLSEALRDAIENGPKTRYRIAQESGINEGTLSRFVTGERSDLRLSTVDKLLPVVGLTWIKKPPSDDGG